MNYKSVDNNVAELFGRGRLGRPALRLAPQSERPELRPRPFQFVPQTGQRSQRSVVRDLKGLIPDTNSDRAELIFLGTLMGIATAAVAMAAIGVTGFAASWNHFTQLVYTLIG